MLPYTPTLPQTVSDLSYLGHTIFQSQIRLHVVSAYYIRLGHMRTRKDYSCSVWPAIYWIEDLQLLRSIYCNLEQVPLLRLPAVIFLPPLHIVGMLRQVHQPVKQNCIWAAARI